MAERIIGYVKGPQGDAATVSVGTTTTGPAGSSAAVTNSGTSGAAVLNFTIPKGDTGAAGAPGVTDYATTEAAGLVRVGDDHNINSSNGILSIKNAFTRASALAKTVSGEAFATSLGKIAKAVDWVVDNAPNFFNKNSDIVDGFTSSLTNKALSANAGKTLKTQLDSLNDSLGASYVIDSIDSESAAINGGTTKWFDIAIPSSYKKPILVGYYITGDGNGFMNAYAAYNTENTATVAVRNMGTTTLTISVKCFIRHF